MGGGVYCGVGIGKGLLYQLPVCPAIQNWP